MTMRIQTTQKQSNIVPAQSHSLPLEIPKSEMISLKMKLSFLIDVSLTSSSVGM